MAFYWRAFSHILRVVGSRVCMSRIHSFCFGFFFHRQNFRSLIFLSIIIGVSWMGKSLLGSRQNQRACRVQNERNQSRRQPIFSLTTTTKARPFSPVTHTVSQTNKPFSQPANTHKTTKKKNTILRTPTSLPSFPSVLQP